MAQKKNPMDRLRTAIVAQLASSKPEATISVTRVNPEVKTRIVQELAKDGLDVKFRPVAPGLDLLVATQAEGSRKLFPAARRRPTPNPTREITDRFSAALRRKGIGTRNGDPARELADSVSRAVHQSPPNQRLVELAADEVDMDVIGEAAVLLGREHHDWDISVSARGGRRIKVARS